MAEHTDKDSSAITSAETTPSWSPIVPFRFLGAGFYLAWIFTIHFSTNVFDAPDSAMESFILSNAANFLCLVVAAIFAQRISPISEKKSIIWIAGISSFLGTILAAFAGFATTLYYVLLICGNMMIGIGTALLILLWSELYSSLPRKEVSIFYSGSFVVIALLFYFISVLPTIQRAVAVTLLPVCSVLMFVASTKLLPHQAEEVRESSASRWSFPVRPSILLAVYAFATTASRSMKFDSTEISMVGLLAIALVVLFCNIFLYDRFDTRLLYKITPPLMVAGFIFISFFDSLDGLGSILINAGFSGFVILTLIVLSNISYTYGVNAVWLFAVTRAARVLANLLAASGYQWLASVGLADVQVIGAFIIILIVTCAMFFLSDKDFTSSWGLTPVTEKQSGTAETFYTTLEGKSSLIARRFGLTQREEEILALLADDKSLIEIEDTLFISNNTVKSHIRHIYAKLGIHSREEAIKLVEGA